MAYVGHHLSIKDDLSVIENLRFMRDFLGVSGRNCKDVMIRLGLGRVADQLARTLSAGQRKRCALGRLLLGKQRIVAARRTLIPTSTSKGLDWWMIS